VSEPRPAPLAASSFVCRDCQVPKASSERWIDGDGRARPVCAECGHLRMIRHYRKYRERHRTERLAAERKRHRSPEDIARRAERRERERGSPKVRARRLLETAIRNGTIIKPNACEHCGAMGRLHGHHPDYDKPLDVRWLCALCHGKEHAKYA